MNGVTSVDILKPLYKFPANNDRSRNWLKLKERDWKIKLTKVDAGDFKHELLNRLRSTLAVNVLRKIIGSILYVTIIICHFCELVYHLYTAHSAMHGGVVWWAVTDDGCQIKQWSCVRLFVRCCCSCKLHAVFCR